MSAVDVSPRRERWQRFAPFTDNIHFLIPEVADDLDDQDRAIDRIARDMAKLKGIMLGVLVSTTTGAVLLALNLAVKGGM